MRQAVDKLWSDALLRLGALEKSGLLTAALAGLLASAGTEEFAPLGSAVAAAAWLTDKFGLYANAGAVLGAALCGRWAGLCQTLTYLALRLVWMGRPIRAKGRDKLLLLLCAGLLTAPFFYLGSVEKAMTGLSEISVSLVFAAVFCRALSGILRTKLGRAMGERDMTALFLTAGALCTACAGISARGFSAGNILAAGVAVFFAGSVGIYSVAAAAVAGAGCVLGGGSIEFVGAIAIAALGASALGKTGRFGVGAGFLAVAAFCAYYGGCGPSAAFEAGVAACVYMAVPAALHAKLSQSFRLGRSVAEERLTTLTGRVKDTAVVLDRVSALFEASPESELELFAGKQLRCMSEAITSIPEARGEPPRFGMDYGMAACPKEGSREAGDSMAVREINGGKLVILSDGMGSGAVARRESAAAVALIGDLLSVGVSELDALECVNRLLMYKSEYDMYATIDAMTFDHRTGRARFLKLGAPSSFIVRGSEVTELSAETLPIGIVAAAKPARREVTLEKGDTVVMMTDGVSDALEDQLAQRVGEIAAQNAPPAAQAEALLTLARANLTRDDMSVIVVKIC